MDMMCREVMDQERRGQEALSRGAPVLYQDIADQNRFRTSLTVSAARLSRCPGKSSES